MQPVNVLTGNSYRLPNGQRILVLGLVNTTQISCTSNEPGSPPRNFSPHMLERQLLILHTPECFTQEHTHKPAEIWCQECVSQGILHYFKVLQELPAGAAIDGQVTLPKQVVPKVQEAALRALECGPTGSDEPSYQQICATSALANIVEFPQPPGISQGFQRYVHMLQAACQDA